MNRKSFVKFIAFSVAAGTFTAFLEACKKKDISNQPSADFTLDLNASANAALLQSGGYLVSNNVMVINNNGSYVALSDVCTHQGCSLGYSSGNKQLACPCHGATFSLTGAVVTGPASTDLKVFSVSKSGSTLHISG